MRPVYIKTRELTEETKVPYEKSYEIPYIIYADSFPIRKDFTEKENINLEVSRRRRRIFNESGN